MVHGYQRANAGDLAAAVAFHALVALIPTFLLCLAVAGLFLRVDQVLITAIYASLWGLPPEASRDALEAALTARRASGWLATLSLVGFAWAGTSFVGCLARSMNRIYAVPGCGFMCEKRRGFFVILGFAVLFMLALLSSTIPTLFVRQDLPQYFHSWALAAGRYQALGYILAFGHLAGDHYGIGTLRHHGPDIPHLFPGAGRHESVWRGVRSDLPARGVVLRDSPRAPLRRLCERDAPTASQGPIQVRGPPAAGPGRRPPR
jgi:hypothetical protein